MEQSDHSAVQGSSSGRPIALAICRIMNDFCPEMMMWTRNVLSQQNRIVRVSNTDKMTGVVLHFIKVGFK